MNKIFTRVWLGTLKNAGKSIFVSEFRNFPSISSQKTKTEHSFVQYIGVV